ncbi:T9SS C-terminal target domain-containing protein [Marinilabiliaceae bacterium JC017]|nr:T9SS C-terminal target domain-containing protein [Marinilabiliaceae bacterium JC017]
MKIILLLFTTLVCSLGLAQEYKEMINSGSYTLKEIQESAENYFTTRGKGKGTGYKQYKRWEYNALRMQDDQGRLNDEHSYIKELNRLNNDINKSGLKSTQVTGNWKPIGPINYTASSGYSPGVGRITSIAVDKANHNNMIVGSETGGVWKTTDKGKTWVPLCDNFSNMKVYSLALDPTNSDTYYWGSDKGIIYKSTNAGASWIQLASAGGRGAVNRILIDPTNPSKMFATCEYSGIYKSVNGGNKWIKVTEDNRGIDVEFKPGDYNTIYATGSGFHKSTDGGNTWTTINGTFNSDFKLIGVTPADASVVYVVEANGGLFGGFYVSNNSGTSFTKKYHPRKNYFGYSTQADDKHGQAPRDMAIAVSPTNKNEVHIAGILTFRSINGGDTFKATSDWIPYNARYANIGYCHADVDDMVFYGNDLYVVSDGGVFICDHSTSVDPYYYRDLTFGMGIHQFYRIGISQTNPVVISGGAQDNGTSAFINGSWKNWIGADGMESFVDKNNPNIMYGTIQFGMLIKTENGANTNYAITPRDENYSELSGNWVTPFEQDPIKKDRIYAGYNQVYKSDDGGESWEAISQKFPENLDHVKIAPSNNKIMYAAHGYDLYKTSTGSGTWDKITGFSGYINYIAINPNDPNIVAIATTSYDKVYITTDGGNTWQTKNSGLPEFSALSLAWDKNDNGLYLGMNYGVYYINDNLSSWQLYNNLLPNVMINELEINYADNQLYAATYGRGVWRTPLYKDPALSTNEVNATADIVVFPNPATSVITIQGKQLGENTEVRLFDINGRLVYYKTETDLNNHTITTDTFDRGVYFLRINSSKGVYTEKIVIN